MKEIDSTFHNTKLQKRINFGKSKIPIHSTKKNNQLCSNVPTTIVLFAIFLFLFFVLEIGILHKHSIYLNNGNIFQHKLTTKNEKILIFLKTEETLPSSFF